jgi:hypothetical protein
MRRQVASLLIVIGWLAGCGSSGPTPLPVSPTPELRPSPATSPTSSPPLPTATAQPTSTSRPTIVALPTSTEQPSIPTPTSAMHPAALSLVGHIGGHANAVSVAEDAEGGFVYAGLGPELAIVDVADPSQPTRRGYVVLPQIVRDVAIRGQFAYVAAGEAGLQIVDVSNAPAPVVVATLDVPGSADRVAVAGARAYVADGPELVIRVVDISNPLAPVEVDSIPTERPAHTLLVDANYLYIAGGAGDYGPLEVVGLAGSDNAGERALLFEAERVADVAVAGQYAFAVGSSLHVFDVSSPLAASEVAAGDGLGGTAVTVADDYAYVLAGEQGLRVVDVTVPLAPVELAHVPLPGYAVDVAVSGDLAYVAGEGGGLHSVNVADPTAPVAVGALPAPGYPVDVAPLGEPPGHVVVADGVGRLTIVDASNPPAPVQVSAYALRGLPGGVAVADSLAFVADQLTPGLEIVDLASVTQPVEAGFLELPAPVFDVATAGNRVYIADGYLYEDGEPVAGGLRMVDVAELNALREVGFWDMPGQGLTVATGDDIAFVGSSDSGMRIVEVVDPQHPVELGFVATRGPVTGLDVDGNYTYLADGWGQSLRIVDTADLRAPVETGFYYVAGLTDGVAAVEDSYVCVTDWTEGLHVLDVADPTAPKEIAFWPIPGSAMAVVVVDGQLYVAAGDGGLFTLTFVPPERAVQSPASPATLASAPPVGAFRPEGEFADLWSTDDLIRRSLRWAVEAEPHSTSAAVQPFEGGLMIWREDDRQIYTLYADGSWMAVDDTWTEDQPASDPAITAPADHFQPIRGFGKVWRNNRQVRGRLGWGLEPERGVDASVQPFQSGSVIELDGRVYVLVADAAGRLRWYRR